MSQNVKNCRWFELVFGGMATDRATILAAYASLQDAVATVNGLDYSGLSIADLLGLQSLRETMKCAAEATDHRILAAAQTQATAKDIGAKDWVEVLHVRHRISRRKPGAGSGMPIIWVRGRRSPARRWARCGTGRCGAG